jgi:hypothetical protein
MRTRPRPIQPSTGSAEHLHCACRRARTSSVASPRASRPTHRTYRRRRHRSASRSRACRRAMQRPCRADSRASTTCHKGTLLQARGDRPSMADHRGPYLHGEATRRGFAGAAWPGRRRQRVGRQVWVPRRTVSQQKAARSARARPGGAARGSILEVSSLVRALRRPLLQPLLARRWRRAGLVHAQQLHPYPCRGHGHDHEPLQVDASCHRCSRCCRRHQTPSGPQSSPPPRRPPSRSPG